MQNMMKIKDGFVQHGNSHQSESTRFVRLESPDADAAMTVAFYEPGPPVVSVFPAARPDGYWDPIGAPQFYVDDDVDGMAERAMAHVPSYRIRAGQADAIAAYFQRVDRTLSLLDAAIAKVRAGNRFLDDVREGG